MWLRSEIIGVSPPHAPDRPEQNHASRRLGREVAGGLAIRERCQDTIGAIGEPDRDSPRRIVHAVPPSVCQQDTCSRRPRRSVRATSQSFAPQMPQVGGCEGSGRE